MTHYNIPIELLNHADDVLVYDSVLNLPNGCDSSISEIRNLAAEGNSDARYIVRKAMEGNEIARDYAGSRYRDEYCDCENPEHGDEWVAIGSPGNVMDFQVCERCDLPIMGTQATHEEN